MSAQEELQAAQAATAEATQQLADLLARADAGDTTVTGAEVAAAEAQITLANRRQAGAAARAEAETLARNAAQADAAIAKLVADYRITVKSVGQAVAAAHEALTKAVEVAAAHERATRANIVAARAHGPEALGHERFNSLIQGSIDGVGFAFPTPVQILDGLMVATALQAHLPVPFSFPQNVIQPIRKFLPA